MRLPSDYESGAVGSASFVVRHGMGPFVRGAIESAGTLEAFAAGRARAVLAGRGNAYVIEAPRRRLVVRHYRRGGAVAAALGDRYARLGEFRPFHELWVSAVGRSRGVSTPAVVAAVVYPSGPFYRGDLATDYVPDSMTLADITFGERLHTADERMAAWHAAGRLLRATADAGLVHADLNLRNVLIAWRAGRPVPHLLDLDRCRLVARVSRREIDRMKARLHRSAHRFGQATGNDMAAEFDALDEGLRA